MYVCMCVYVCMLFYPYSEYICLSLFYNFKMGRSHFLSQSTISLANLKIYKRYNVKHFKSVV